MPLTKRASHAQGFPLATLDRAKFFLVLVFLVSGALASGTIVGVRYSHGQKLAQIPDVGNPIVGTFTSEETDVQRLVLTAGPNLTVAMKPDRQTAAQYWTIAPVGRETVRLQLFEDGKFWSLEVDSTTGAVGFRRSDQKLEQLWRITPSLAVKDTVRLESAAFRGRYLAGYANSNVVIEPPSPAASQNWYFDVAPPPPTIDIPTQQMVQVNQQVNPPLDSVRTRLMNSHSNTLLVRITDLRTLQFTDLTIPAGQTQDVTLERDAGATIVESYRVVGPFGNVLTRQFTTSIPPAPLYDITVYERFLQSIAIDRTGKSPNKIEDISYQPKSVGLFLIPPGRQFEGGGVDVYKSAKKANNPGAARRINPDLFESKSASDPLEQALKELRDR